MIIRRENTNILGVLKLISGFDESSVSSIVDDVLLSVVERLIVVSAVEVAIVRLLLEVVSEDESSIIGGL